jgi:MFS superfamily sulfate permease-like transporter
MSEGLLIATLVLCLVILGTLLLVGLILGITWACGGSCRRSTPPDIEMGRTSP